MDMTPKPIQWGEHRDSCVRMDPHGQEVVEIVAHSYDAPVGVLQWPEVVNTRLTKSQALKLGQALVKLGRS
jgi:hypothetical protein